jgi:hypothetical protein
MIYVATVEDGVVTRVTVETEPFTPAPDQAVIGPDNVVGIGWLYDGSSFAPPVTEEEA